MARPENRLVILHDNNSTFVDRSLASYDFGRDSYVFDFVAAEDKLYIGFTKPINKVYAEMSTANTASATLTAEYYNGTAFTALDGLIDDSLGLTRSGFIQWRRGQTDEAETTINSEEMYWYRLSWDVDLDVGTAIQGLNIVFSDDEDLKEEYFEILEFLSENETTFILKHQAARNEIVQFLRNRGNIKRNNDDPINLGTTRIKNITEWDLLESEEARQASKYIALAKVFRNASDNVDDKWYQLFRMFHDKGQDILSGLAITLDSDDDGEVDTGERLRQTGVVRITRI